MKALLVITIALMAALGSIPDAHAQDAAQLERSDKHYKEGSRLYHEGDYPGAVLELKTGYDIAPHPIFLVNIALAYAKLDNWTEAASWGRRAVAEPGLEGEAHAQTGGWAEAWNLRDRSERAAVAISENAVELVELGPDEPASPRRFGPLGWIGLSTAVAGGLAVGGATLIGVMLQDERAAYEAAAAAGDSVGYEANRKRIDNQQLLGRVLLFGGAGLVAIGGTLFVVDAVTLETQASVTLNGPEVRVVLTW